MKINYKKTKGFTLVELLVVISIIAVLAGVAMPVFSQVQLNGRITAASGQVRGIFQAMTLYASDHDGVYPKADKSSNEGFRKLIPDQIGKTEKPFKVPSSGWHKDSKDGTGPDENIGNPPEYTEALERGENHWAYVTGLNNSTDATMPLIADGFTDGGIGTYTDKQTEKGGVWRGTKSIVVYCDGSVVAENLDKKTFQVMKNKGGTKVNVFSADYDVNPNDVKNPE